MTEAVQAADSGPLTVDQAIESLLPPPVEAHEEAAPVEAAAEEPEGETSTPEEPADEAETLADGKPEEEAVEEAATPLDPPLYWSQEAKAKFAALPADLQAVVLEQEGPREAAAAKAKQEAAEERKTANAEIAGVRQLAEQLATFLPKAVETFQQTWGETEPDWAAYAQEHGADNAFILQSQFNAQRQQLAKIAQAKQQADVQAREASLREEGEKLKGTPLEPMDARREVATYLASTGYSNAELENATARDLMLARKAMLYDRGQAALKAKPPKPATPAPAKAPVRPAAGQPGTPQSRTAQQIGNRFAQTRSVDDAVALLLAKGN